MEMNNQRRRRSMFLYVIIALAVMLAVNQSMTMYQRQQVKDVSYSEFLTMVERNQVRTVDLNTGTGKIRFTDGDGSSATTTVYETTQFPNDANLVSLLQEHEVDFSAEIPDTSGDLWLYMLLSYGLPIAIMVFFGWRLNRRMKNTLSNEEFLASMNG